MFRLVFLTTILLGYVVVKDSWALSYINTSFENASPLWWEEPTPGKVDIYLTYDQERNSTNRANGHWHFEIQGEPGSQVELTLHNLENVWNGKAGFPLSDKTRCNISEDGHRWTSIESEVLKEDKALRFNVTLHSGRLLVAHLEPYRVSDLNHLISEIESHPLVKIQMIGKTVQGRPLEIIRIGSEDAPHRVFLRARAHAWEPGGNWVVQGLIQSLLSNDPENRAYLDRYAIYIMPMANKDGVARGWTRFNQLGKDLNRNWDKPADPELAPENAALEKWFKKMIDQGKKPDLNANWIAGLNQPTSGKNWQLLGSQYRKVFYHYFEH